MKTLITRPLPESVLAAARASFDVTVRPETSFLSTEDMIAALQDYDAILPTLGDSFSGEIFAAAGSCRAKILANFGVGFNHIDVAAAKAAGLVVTNTPGAVTDATADIAMTLMLMTARRAGEGERMLRAGNWEGWHPTQMLGMHLSGKTVGIIGMGRIGKAIAARCHFGFGMRVVFHNRSTVSNLDVPAQQLDNLEEVMGEADVVVIAVPGGAATHHLIDRAALSHMRAHAILVNIARGDIVDEVALIDALEEGRIAGAGLDVYEFEPRVPERLIALENTTLLPHLGTAALDVREAMGMMAVDNLVAFANGEALPNQVS